MLQAGRNDFCCEFSCREFGAARLKLPLNRLLSQYRQNRPTRTWSGPVGRFADIHQTNSDLLIEALTN